ncbi:hypothetical protein J4P41_01875 [Gluconobacter sp. NFX36]|uniref:hypothetical protein n=1 Tax=Gluconobacter sp. NFX36 TaxID=2819535 RepID=UPI003CE6ABD0
MSSRHPLLQHTRTQSGFDRFLQDNIEPDVHDQARSLQDRLTGTRNLAARNARLGDERMAQIWERCAEDFAAGLSRLLTLNLLPESVPDFPEPVERDCRPVTVTPIIEIDAARLAAHCWKQVQDLRDITMGAPLRRHS